MSSRTKNDADLIVKIRVLHKQRAEVFNKRYKVTDGYECVHCGAVVPPFNPDARRKHNNDAFAISTSFEYVSSWGQQTSARVYACPVCNFHSADEETEDNTYAFCPKNWRGVGSLAE